MPSARAAGYAPLADRPSIDEQEREREQDQDQDYRPLRRSVQAEFNRPPPAWWKRLLLILGLVAMGWLVMYLGGMGRNKPKVIYASRYSEEYKYRPAISPVITEYLPDGRIRLRGASPGGVGVNEADFPLTGAKKEAREKARREEARDKAKAKMGLKTKKIKAQEKARKMEDEARKKVRERMGMSEI